MVEASKVINKVARETGFPYIPDHLGKWGRSVWGGGKCLFERSSCLTLWPRGWALIWGGGLLKYNVYLRTCINA